MPAAATAAATAASAGLNYAAGSNAADAAKKATAANLAFTQGVYSDAKNNLTPTINQGVGAGSELGGLLGLPGFDAAASQRAFDTFRNSTNYNFLLNQGTQAVKTANAPSFNSGATAKALLNYGQGMAGSALAGYEGLLQGQQTLGAQSALGLAQAGLGAGQQIIGANNALAAAQGSAGLYGANALGSGLAGLAKLFQSGQSASSYPGAGGKGFDPNIPGT